MSKKPFSHAGVIGSLQAMEAFDSKMHYRILSLMDRENPMLHSFHVEKGIVTKEELVIR